MLDSSSTTPLFQSTLLMRGATCRYGLRQVAHAAHFNPRSSCEERLEQAALQSDAHISIHAPHARSDIRDSDLDALTLISIHAPHARSDVSLAYTSRAIGNFNPRSSCEERRIRVVIVITALRISIHAPHARSDRLCEPRQTRDSDFNPRSSCEERHLGDISDGCYTRISIHAPHARSDFLRNFPLYRLLVISIHAPHARSDVVKNDLDGYFVISIHAPHARSDDDVDAIGADVIEFQSTLLMRGATRKASRHFSVCEVFQSTLLMRGATLSTCVQSPITYVFQSTLLMRGATSM